MARSKSLPKRNLSKRKNRKKKTLGQEMIGDIKSFLKESKRVKGDLTKIRGHKITVCRIINLPIAVNERLERIAKGLKCHVDDLLLRILDRSLELEEDCLESLEVE